MNPESIDRLIAKNPKLRNKRQKLEQMHDGAYWMTGSWGFGRIVSYDEASKKLIIDFEGKPGHKMDPVFCVDKLEVLDDDNLLVRYRTDRENLEKEMKDSGEFVVSYLEKKPDMSASMSLKTRPFLKKNLRKKTRSPKKHTGLGGIRQKKPCLEIRAWLARKSKENLIACALKRRK